MYECDACKKTIKDPYEVKMKEFYVGCFFENCGIFPSNDKRKVKIHLCDGGVWLENTKEFITIKD